METKNQVSKSLSDFLDKLQNVPARMWKTEIAPPSVPLVIRIAVAGHLDVQPEPLLQKVTQEVLSALKEYAYSINPDFHKRLFDGQEITRPHLRIVSQLAAGFDQIVANVATSLDINLHVVLPGPIPAFQQSIKDSQEDNPEAAQKAIDGFNTLTKKVNRTLELDFTGTESNPQDFAESDFQQAASVILDNCDILLLAIRANTFEKPGGTMWMESRATALGLPIIRIPVESPTDVRLFWTQEDARTSTEIFDAKRQCVPPDVYSIALTESLIGAGVAQSSIKLGLWERGYANQFDPVFNAKFWNKRWSLGPNDATTRHTLGRATADLDNGLKDAKVWADCRASAMAELVRGSFIVCTLLGTIAIACAMTGLIFPTLSSHGKVLELVCLSVVLMCLRRSNKFRWRSQWLNIRQVERCLDQAAWLGLLARTRAYTPPPHLKDTEFDPVSRWCASYLRAVLRNASFPGVSFTEDYRSAAHNLILTNVVKDQIDYYSKEAEANHRSEETLEHAGKWLIATAAGTTALYLISYHLLATLFPVLEDHEVHHLVSVCITVTGVLLTALATGLSAIRTHGEYAEIAARYRSTATALRKIEQELDHTRPDHGKGTKPATSAILTQIVRTTTDVLLHEVQGWSAILRKKNIELG